MISETESHLRILLNGFKYYRKSGYKLASGDTSPYFYDIKTAMGNSQIIYEMCVAIEKKIQNYDKIKSVGGIETGSIPIASAFVLYHSLITNTDLNFFYIRKEKKVNGTEKMIEGMMRSHSVIIEDVMTKGNTVKNALDIANDNCQKVDLVIPIIFRGDEGDKLKLQMKLKVVIDPIFYEKDFNEV